MTPLDEVVSRSPVHWGYYFTTMALRKGRPFWPDMGLNLSSTLENALFELTVEALDSFMGADTRLTDVSGAHCMEVLGRYLLDVADLSFEKPQDDPTEVVQWVLGTFFGGREKNYEWLWRSTLTAIYWGFQKGEVPKELSFGRKDEVESLATEFFLDLRVTGDALEGASKKPLEKLDWKILAYYDIISAEEVQENFSPFDVILHTYAAVRFRSLWLELLRRSDQEMMDALYAFFQRFLLEKRIDKTRPALLHPPTPELW